MKRIMTASGMALLVATVIVGCAAAPTNSQTTDRSVQMLSEHDAAELTFLYHQVAQAMWNEARRLETQAALPEMRGEETSALLEQAGKFATMAVAAETAAEKYRRQARNNAQVQTR